MLCYFCCVHHIVSGMLVSFTLTLFVSEKSFRYPDRGKDLHTLRGIQKVGWILLLCFPFQLIIEKFSYFDDAGKLPGHALPA